MSELRLKQIVVSGSVACDWLYGVDELGRVWTLVVDGEDGQKWRKVPMTKAEGEE